MTRSLPDIARLLPGITRSLPDYLVATAGQSLSIIVPFVSTIVHCFRDIPTTASSVLRARVRHDSDWLA